MDLVVLLSFLFFTIRSLKYVFVFIIAEGTFATLPRTSRGVAIVLGGDPKGKNFLYTNGNSVIIRDIAVQFRLLLLTDLYLMI